MSAATPGVSSPCIGVCTMRADGLCDGCLRTLNEIAVWSQMEDDARQELMKHLPKRACMSHHHSLLPEWAALARALHPLDVAPGGQSWNKDELRGLQIAHSTVPAAVLVGLIPRSAGTTVLLTRRHDDLRHHGGQVSFPGGRVDVGDVNAVAAALRESDEEIALKRSQVEPVGLLDSVATVSGFLITPVVAAVDPDFVPVPSPAEVAEVFEVPLDYLMAPQNLRNMRIEFKGRQRTVLEYDWAEQRIWGATATILYNLRLRLEAVA